MSEGRENDREFINMSCNPDTQHLFDATGHLTISALNESIDGTLIDRDERVVQSHLAGCAACAAQRAELETTVRLLRALPEVESSRSFAVTAQKTGSAPAASRSQGWLTPAFPVLRVAVAAVFLLLVGVASVDVLTQRDDDADELAMLAETPNGGTDTEAIQAPPTSTRIPLPSTGGGYLVTAESTAETEEAMPTDEMPIVGGPGGAPAGETTQAESVALALKTGGPGNTPTGEITLAEPAGMSGAEVADEDSLAMEQEEAGIDGESPSDQAAASPEAATPEATPSPIERQESGDDKGGLSNWRIAEIALLLLLLWLIVTWIGLARMRRR
jgi:hypothetical protein